MRAVFTIDLPRSSEKYPDDNSILTVLRGYGWEFRDMNKLTEYDVAAMLRSQGGGGNSISDELKPPISRLGSESAGRSQTEGNSTNRAETLPAEITTDEDAMRQQYARLARRLFDEMPEVAAAEQKHVMFVGYFSDDQTLFVVTRMVQRELKFRLLHRDLARLQSSTEKMMREVVATRLQNGPLNVSNPTIEVYERMFDHVILTGRVITSAISETVTSDLKDVLLCIVPLLLLLPTAYVLLHYQAQPGNPHDLLRGTLERGSTALITTALISMLGLLQTWLVIRRSRLIDWTVKPVRKK